MPNNEQANQEPDEPTSLHVIANALAYIAMRISPVRKSTNNSERVVFLNRLGLDRNAIASMLSVKPDYVSEQVSKAKAKKKDKKTRGKNKK